ncbi:MAG TPA: Holliday junction branch migration protein RuvA [Gammaproteobacteria bacterium]|nr:Holliday junction branch migration protein RuvA [Gammaproteobacteria bacterium]
MIGRLRGVLLLKQAPHLLLDVNGVGYEVDAPMSTFYSLPEQGSEITLQIHMVVREDSQTLYGFNSEAERSLFRSLIKVNGVGARLALTILSGISVDEFAACVEQHDSASLVRLPGIGKKTAERLIIEMRDRLKDLPAQGASTVASADGHGHDPVQDAVSALIALGYKPPEASRMVRSVPSADGKGSEDLIRLALQSAIN